MFYLAKDLEKMVSGSFDKIDWAGIFGRVFINDHSSFYHRITNNSLLIFCFDRIEHTNIFIRKSFSFPHLLIFYAFSSKSIALIMVSHYFQNKETIWLWRFI